MQTYQSSTIPNQGPKNYVFVDEHNRHKRLKVMRACEGCRRVQSHVDSAGCLAGPSSRRKIKCDAATSNTWPCAACKRLKLTCVPPVGGADGELSVLDTDVDQFPSQPASAPVQQYQNEDFGYLQNYGSQPDLAAAYTTFDMHGTQPEFSHHEFAYSGPPHDPSQLSVPSQQLQPQHRYSSFDSVNDQNPHRVGSPQSTESVTAEDLAESLGDLRITDVGVAPYIRQQHTSQREAPAPIVEDEDDLPPFSTAAGSQIRIPPALMPTNEEASKAFQEFFKHVHPYVPVLCRGHFVRQWQNNRDSLSPLLLEAVFACAGQVSDDPAGGSQWLALANRHEESFADTPRLSTIQALLLLLKAREKTPKRGYYYRSWITVKKIVGMAKDLELHEHHDLHANGGNCDSTPEECLSKTRIWQLTMVIELMVGGPQGRTDYGVDLDTVEIGPSPPNSDIDDYEKALSRQFSYWVRNVRNIRGLLETSQRLKRKNIDYASDPTFLAYNDDFDKWLSLVPEDLHIPKPVNNSLPQFPSHFLANMHSHHQLGIVMLYRPQLTASKEFAHDEKWKYIMSTSYTAAKQVCILQEAILQKFDVLGLACMQRGLSFPIYAILSCVMLHLIAITSPDPTFNLDAKDYFVRHMRILERCIAEWPMPEVEAQINGLRAAFSVNLQRPFELKPSFPYGTPSEHSRSPEERRSSEPIHQHIQTAVTQQHFPVQIQTGQFYRTPPAAVQSLPAQHNPPFYQDYNGDSTAHQYHHFPPTSNPQSAVTPTEPWNPTPIIDQFTAAFAIPQSALAPPPASSYSSSPPGTIHHQNFHNQRQAQQYVPSPTSAGGYSTHQYTPSPTSQPMPNPQSYMSNQSQRTPQSQLTPSHHPHHATNSYFDGHMAQTSNTQHVQPPQLYGSANGNFTQSHTDAAATGPVYVTAKEWQQSVASVFDNGLKRKWGYEQPLGLHHQGRRSGNYGSIG